MCVRGDNCGALAGDELKSKKNIHVVGKQL